MVEMQSEQLREIVGNNLRSRRKELGLTQAEVAKRAGISQVYVSHIETGRHAADTDLLAKLADALETSPLVLLSPEPVFSQVGA